MKNRNSVINLAAYCFIKWKMLLVCMLIGLIGVGGLQGVKQIRERKASVNNAQTRNEEYNQQKNEYDKAISAYEQQKAVVDSMFAETQEYLNDSLLMKLDPYNVSVCVIDFAISLPEDEEYTTSVRYYTTPEEYLTTRIQNAYIAMWNACDAASVTDCYPEAEDKYVKEMVQLEVVPGAILEIKAMGETDVQAAKLAADVYKFIEASCSRVAATVESHKITQISEYTKTTVVETLVSKQKDRVARLEELTTTKANLNKKEGEIKSPAAPAQIGKKQIVVSAAKYGILGMIAGLLVAVFISVMECVLNNRLVVSAEISEDCQIPFWGTLSTKRNVFLRLSDILSGEQVWSDEKSALEYIVSRCKNSNEGKEVTIITTLKKEKVEDRIQQIICALEEKGIQSHVYYSAAHSGELLSKAGEQNNMIMVEEISRSKMSLVKALNNNIISCKGKVSGFVVLR